MRRRGDHEAWPQSAEDPRGADPCGPLGSGDLCRARHHGGSKTAALRRADHRSRALFRPGAGARPAGPAMNGRLVVLGLGPGPPGLQTPDAVAARAAATDLVGYGPYLDRVAVRADQIRHASDNREELD